MGEIVFLAGTVETPVEVPGLPSGLVTRAGRSIERVTMECRLGAVTHEAGGLQTSLLAHFRYLDGAGTDVASEWLALPVTLRREGGAWSCQIGRSWCWSTDWPDSGLGAHRPSPA